MNPHFRAHLFTTAFLPMECTIDRRAEYYLRQIYAIGSKPQLPAPPPPRWRLALECLAVWGLVSYALLWLAVRWGWIA